MLRPLLLMTLLCLVAAPSGNAGDWPQFRGSTGQGLTTATNLPTEWSYSPNGASKNIAWKTAIPGQGWSSPVVLDDRVYLTTAIAQPGGQSSLHALALAAANGAILWNVEVFRVRPGPKHDKNSNASPTPVVEAGRLYAHFGHEGTACLDLDGNLLWRNTSLSYDPFHGNGGSPILAGDALIFSADGARNPFVAALHKNTGRVLWRAPREIDSPRTFSFSTPLLIEVNNRLQVISPASGAVCSYDPQNGREIWRVRYPDGYSVVPRPVYGRGLLFLSSGFDRPAILAIRPDGQGDVTATHVAWTLRRGAPTTPSPLLLGDDLYVLSDSGIASCVDADTGHGFWQERIGGNCSASPLAGDGKIYFQNEEGLGVVVRAGRKFEKLASNPLHERTLASYAVDGNALLIRGAQHLFRIEEDQSRNPGR